jgi:hypothetical protein
MSMEYHFQAHRHLPDHIHCQQLEAMFNLLLEYILLKGEVKEIKYQGNIRWVNLNTEELAVASLDTSAVTDMDAEVATSIDTVASLCIVANLEEEDSNPPLQPLLILLATANIKTIMAA